MKLPAGYGSVTKRKGRFHNPYRVYLPAQYEIEKDKKGNPILDEKGLPVTKCIRPTLGYYRTRKEGLEALALYHKDPNVYNSQTITFKELYEWWSEEKFKEVGYTSRIAYKNAFLHSELLHNISIGDIKAEHMQAVVDTLTKKSASYSLKSNLKQLYHHLFNYAIQKDLLNKNYAQFVKTGQNITKTKRELYTKEIRHNETRCPQAQTNAKSHAYILRFSFYKI